jgi:hypothetical protein
MADSTRNVVNKQPVVLDPNFFAPPGVVDVRYVNDSETDGLYSEGETINDVLVDGELAVPDDITQVSESAAGLQPPASVTIVSQTVRVAADGRFAVDVTIEVDDVPGITNYETRLTKV